VDSALGDLDVSPPLPLECLNKGLPYPDGIKYYMIKDLSVRAKSVRTGRTDVELRGFPSSEVEAIKKQMGDRALHALRRFGFNGSLSDLITLCGYEDRGQRHRT